MKLKTLQLFLDLLEALSAQEASLEYSRELLANHDDFEPYAVFQRMDTTHKGFLTNDDIYEFLITNGLSQSEKSCGLFLRHFDYDQDQTLVYSEYLTFYLIVD